MRKIQFIITHNKTINALANDKQFVIPADHPNYKALLQAIRDDDADAFVRLADIPKAVSQYMSGGKVKVENGSVYYDGQVCNSEVANKILELMDLDLPADSMINFLDKLMQNPSKHSVDELFMFLQQKGLPIAEDGDFYAYKRVNQDFTDCYSRNFDNSVGKHISVSRNTVDDDWRNNCSSGFHIGSMEYVRNFNTHGRIIIVKVNPKDVVAVPSYESSKCRTCAYLVVAEYNGDLIESPVYSAVEPHNVPNPVLPNPPDNPVSGSSFLDDDFDDEDEDFDDEDDFDDDDDLDDDDDEDWERQEV